jgi:NADPH:quinone reductase-like Zn-dependent oxidoreductase
VSGVVAATGQLRELATLIDKQQARPMVSAVLELSALPGAFRAQRARRDPGKVVISVASTTGR